MDKRLFIAVMLSIAFLFAWGAIVPRLFPDLAKPKDVPRPASDVQRPGSNAATATVAAVEPASGKPKPAAIPTDAGRGTQDAGPVTAQQATSRVDTVIDNDYFTARFTNRGAQLVSFRLKKYTQKDSAQPVDLVAPRAPNATDYPFAMVTADAALNRRVNEALYVVKDDTRDGIGQLQYRYTDPSGATILKTFTFSADPYRFNFSVQSNRGNYRIIMGPGIRALSPEEQQDRFIRAGNAVIQRDGSFEIVPREKVPQFQIEPGMPQFVGLEDNYFLAVWQPQHAGDATFRAVAVPAAKKGTTRQELYVGLNSVNGRVTGDAFFGPKETALLDRYGLDQALQFGMFGFIARLLLAALQWLYGITHNYGWAIVVLTIIIKVLLYPLQHKSIVSMKKMQRLQPRMNAIREKYKKAKTDPEQRQRMNTEMMKLYQQEGINPMSGCLPLLLQLPILWAFYSLLSVAIELRGADFMLWINDLSAKDPYYITPILMTVTMFIQQWMTPTTADPAQRKIFLAMPFIFGWIFKEFPSGLVLYWLVQNILSIVQQAIMNKYWKDHPDETRDKAAAKAVQPLKHGKATTRGCLFFL